MDPIDSIKAAAEFTRPEEEIRAELGVSRSVMRQARARLQQDLDWVVGPRGVILWAPRAYAVLVGEARSIATGQTPEMIATEVPDEEKEVAILTVASTAFPNRCILAAVRDQADREKRALWLSVSVLPQKRDLFVPGMQLKAQLRHGTWLWKYLGPATAKSGAAVRYPRLKGHW